MLKSKKLSVAVLAVFFLSIFAGFGIQPAAAATYPTDIAGNWAASQIYSLINQGVVTGYADGTFKPNNSITRAEFMVMINRAFKFNTPASIFYSDVRAGDWFYLDIAKAKAAGYISGYPNGTMGPNNKISRQEAAVILAGVLGIKSTSSSGYLTFSDASKIPSWSWGSISSLVQAGYIGGYPDGTFRPANSITRAEAAVMIYQGMNRVQVTGVKLNKTSLTLGLDKTETLVATVSPSNATNPTVTWSSSNPAVASVSSNGKLTGLKEGTTTITVSTSDGGKTATCKVTVKDVVKVTGVTLNKASITLDVGDTYTLKATVKPSDATNTNVAWTSSRTSVATVSSSGKVTAKKAGTTTITAKTEDGGYKAICRVTVEDRARIDDIDFMDDDITIMVGGTYRLIPQIDPEYGPNQKLTWRTDNRDVATVSSDGVVTARAKGDCVIRVYSSEDDNIEAFCDVTVIAYDDANEAAVDDVSLSENDIELQDGDTFQLFAIIDPDDAHNQKVSWDSDDDDVATVSSSGLVTARGEGRCIIIVTTDDGDYEAECDVEVEGDSGSGELKLSRSSTYLYLDGTKSRTITGTLVDGDGDIDDVDWDCDNNIVDVDIFDEDDDSFSTTIRAIKKGKCTITFTVTTDEGEEYEADFDVTVAY